MNRPIALLLTVALLASPLMLGGCGQGTQADNALSAGNAQLVEYNKLDAEVSAQLAQAASVQPTAEGVKQGLALLDQIDAAMPRRTDAARKAKADFQQIGTLNVAPKSKSYATQAVALTDALLALDAGTVQLTKNMRSLYTLVAKNSPNAVLVQKTADSVDAGQQKLDRLRRRVKSLSDAAQSYYQQNLAGKK